MAAGTSGWQEPEKLVTVELLAPQLQVSVKA